MLGLVSLIGFLGYVASSHAALSALDAANLFFEHLICKYGISKKIILDRKRNFTS